MLKVGETLKERYAIRRVISTGLLSNVYEAEDTALQRRVVLKEFVGKTQRATAARIQREVALYARLRHPNILQLLDVLIIEGQVLLVFPLIEGPTLAALLQRGPMSIADALTHARDLAAALAFVHSRMIIHRDLKPANILLDDGRVVLVDFGIAKDWGEHESLALTRTGQAIGTPLYMAPEAMRNEPVGAPADVYGLGVVIFEMVAGKAPFSGRSFAELVANRLTSNPPALAQVRPETPAALSVLVEQMLSAAATSRPTATQVVEALNAILLAPGAAEREPARAAPPGYPDAVTLDGEHDAAPLSRVAPGVAPEPAPVLPPRFAPRPPQQEQQQQQQQPVLGALSHIALTQSIDPELNRTVVVRDHAVARTIDERTNVQLRGFFDNEFARQDELKRSREFYRTQLSGDYGSLMLQAKISFSLWVLFSIVGFVVFVIGIALLYMGKWQEGAITLVSESIVVFIQKLFKDREDEFRERAAKKNRHVELGNLWNLAAQSLDGLDATTRREKLSRLTDAIIDQVGR